MTFSYGSEMVTVRVGQDVSARDVLVYKRLIRNSSAFFKNAFKGSLRTSEDQSVKLPDFTFECFDTYHMWLLSGRLYSRQADKREVLVGQNVDPDYNQGYDQALWTEMTKLGKLSHLGHYLLDTDFIDTISDAMVQCMIELQAIKCGFPIDEGLRMMANIPKSSPTRDLIFDFVAWTTSEVQMRDICVELRQHPTRVEYLDFMAGISIAMASRLTTSTPPPTSPLEGWKSPETACKYHSHRGEEKCCYLEMKTI
jgi:hypothetical protein